jgi:glucose-6-phosphate 1-epimerase
MEFTPTQRDSLQLVEMATPQARATLSLYGGQVLSFIPAADNRERLYLSDRAVLDGSKSIRGGIPVCWPWFGAHPGGSGQPAHGYVRNLRWRIVSRRSDAHGTTLVIEPESTRGTGFTGTAGLQLEIILTGTLTLRLVTTNQGNTPFPLSCAMHSYFAVGDITETQLTGLSGRYSDKNRNWQHFDTPLPYRFSEETDRIHLQAAPEVMICSPSGDTRVASAGHDSIVVWNPWTRCAENFSDMSASGYRAMLCVETALTQGKVLAPGEAHILTQTIA